MSTPPEIGVAVRVGVEDGGAMLVAVGVGDAATIDVAVGVGGVAVVVAVGVGWPGADRASTAMALILAAP
jgi:hypothetical protein